MDGSGQERVPEGMGKEKEKVRVKLSTQEMAAAAMVGVRRKVMSLKRQETAGHDKTNWSDEIEGAMGECAVAKALGIYWSPEVDLFKVPDVGSLHVRQTSHANGKLIFRPGDADGVYVLIRGSLGEYEIAGWATSEECVNDRYLQAPNGRPPAYFVDSLHPISELK